MDRKFYFNIHQNLTCYGNYVFGFYILLQLTNNVKK